MRSYFYSKTGTDHAHDPYWSYYICHHKETTGRIENYNSPLDAQSRASPEAVLCQDEAPFSKMHSVPWIKDLYQLFFLQLEMHSETKEQKQQ